MIVNIGGIANVSSLKPGRPFAGFDCGPGNVLMDAWARRHRSVEFDEDGRWASEGRPDGALLARLASEPYFAKPPPKSTGRELFGEGWLAARLETGVAPADVQATLLELTAASIVEAIDRFCGRAGRDLPVRGRRAQRAARGAHRRSCVPCPVLPTDALGVPTGHVEAMAFAWLALKCVRREPLDLAAVTGAAHPCILGAIYPA